MRFLIENRFKVSHKILRLQIMLFLGLPLLRVEVSALHSEQHDNKELDSLKDGKVWTLDAVQD